MYVVYLHIMVYNARKGLDIEDADWSDKKTDLLSLGWLSPALADERLLAVRQKMISGD